MLAAGMVYELVISPDKVAVVNYKIVLSQFGCCQLLPSKASAIGWLVTVEIRGRTNTESLLVMPAELLTKLDIIPHRRVKNRGSYKGLPLRRGY